MSSFDREDLSVSFEAYTFLRLLNISLYLFNVFGRTHFLRKATAWTAESYKLRRYKKETKRTFH